MNKFGRAIVSRYNSYRLKERSKLYLHNTTSPLLKLHYRKFNLFYVLTLFGRKALIRKNSQMLQISFVYIH